MTEQTDEVAPRGRGVNIRLVLGAVAAAALAVFVAQNTAEVPVSFLWMDWRFPLYLLLLITVALTIILAMGATWLLRRRGT